MTSTGRYASAPRMGGVPQQATDPYASHRSLTPSRFVSTTPNAAANAPSDLGTPSSTGLIRLSLKKPMGIVFEPMYDPQQKSLQRGVRICDLPRTGAAALSRQLQVGDELLQINDRTVSRLNFDQIMDIIIEADPESVDLLFRRPRKETLQTNKQVTTAAAVVKKQQQATTKSNSNKDAVKWVDNNTDAKKDKKHKDKNKKRSKNKAPVSEDEEEEEEEQTLPSYSVTGDESYVKATGPSRKSKKSKAAAAGGKSSSRKDPYESESFLDVLIDTICANSNNVCRDTFRRNDDDDEYFSDEDESFVTDMEDESTYVTYDESVDRKYTSKRNKKKAVAAIAEEVEDDHIRPDTKATKNEKARRRKGEKAKNKYEDDGTLETNESEERIARSAPQQQQQHPLNNMMAHKASISNHYQPVIHPPTLPLVMPMPEMEQDINVPIKEFEYDGGIDHGADVSVMESLGGPSLLIEKQRAIAQAPPKQVVPQELIERFGLDYPSSYGMTREQTIAADPLKFYTYVVRSLLQEHEPEKVRLLDKLLAKYKGREDHLVQKLAVRYDRPAATEQAPEATNHEAFSDAVKKNKASSSAANAVHVAKERMHIVGAAAAPAAANGFDHHHQNWPDKETKEQEIGDDDEEDEDDGSGSESEYSRDSVDGTSPAVIAQVSELLNYVYGKTSVPGQIDRVSTIMRAYEGREAVLLELLETKALLKANKEKENVDALPSFLRSNNSNNPAAVVVSHPSKKQDLPPVTPMAQQPATVNNDDMSSMSGVSSPAVVAGGAHPDKDADAAGIVNQAVRF